MCVEVRRCLAEAGGSGGLKARDGVLLILPDLTLWWNDPQSHSLHGTSKANPLLISVGICKKKEMMGMEDSMRWAP